MAKVKFSFVLAVAGAFRSALALTPISLGNGQTYASALPVLYVSTADGKDITSKVDYKMATMKLVGNDRYPGVLYEGEGEIKGRGNSSWTQFPKKPYKIKLGTKANLFGFGKNKHWVLLANYNEESLLRNKLAFDLSARMGLVAMESTWVDLVLNGRFRGNYLLCEHIRVDKKRIDVFDWDDVLDETKDITGGYVFENSAEYDEASQFKTPGGLKVMLNTPEFLSDNQRMFRYVMDYWDGFEAAYMSETGYNRQGIHYSSYADVDTMAKFWLIQEIFGNEDCKHKSRYCHKDVGQPIQFGPVWDFDGFPIHPVGWRLGVWDAQNYFLDWTRHADFLERAVAIYRDCHDLFDQLTVSGGEIDRCAEYIEASGRENAKLWPLRYGFDRSTAMVRDYLAKRLQWLDSQFADVRTLERSLDAAYSGRAPHGAALPVKKTQTYWGVVLDGNRTKGLVNIKVSRTMKNGVSRISGFVIGCDGKKRKIKTAKTSVKDAPAVMQADVVGWGHLSLEIGQDAIGGALGGYVVRRCDAGRIRNGSLWFDLQIPESFTLGDGLRPLTDYLPRLEQVSVRKGVFVVGAAPKLKLLQDGTIKVHPASARNLSKLRLKAAVSTGVVKGALTFYAIQDGPKPKLKKFQAKVRGIFANEVATGTVKVGKGKNGQEFPFFLR